MRSRWKGHIRMNLVLIPVKAYNAEEMQDKVKLNMFHIGCGGNVGKKEYCKECNTDLTSDQIFRGYKADSKVIPINDDDVSSLKLESTKVIDILGFVERSEIPVTFYDKPYYIGPDGKVGEQTYDTLRSAILESGKVAVGKVVINSGREDQVVISVENSCLVMCIIRYKDEVRNPVEVPNLSNCTDVPAEQIELALELVKTMTKRFSTLAVVNEYNAKLKEVIDFKLQNGDTAVVLSKSEAKSAPSIDIMAALRASIGKEKGTKVIEVGKGNLKVEKAESKKKKKDKVPA